MQNFLFQIFNSKIVEIMNLKTDFNTYFVDAAYEFEGGFKKIKMVNEEIKI